MSTVGASAEVGFQGGEADTVPQRAGLSARVTTSAVARDARLDSLRGLMLIEIALVHLHCPIGRIIYECFGRVSAAAGFVFLSGILAGAVYSRSAEQGPGVIIQRCVRRSLYIYAYHWAAFLLLLGVLLLEPRAGSYFRLETTEATGGMVHALASYAVWAYQPRLLDILPLYSLFVLGVPAALLALRSNHGLAMLAVSLVLWTLAQLGLGYVPEDATSDFGFFHGDFNPFAWQLVFFSGLYFGHMHLYRRHRIVEIRPLLVVLCVIICIIGFTMRWELLDWPASFGPGGWLASKRDYSPVYFVNFFAFAYLVYGLATRWPRAFNWPVLAFLGRHSIQVFTFHIIALYFATPLIWRAAAHGLWAYNALGAALIAGLFVAAWCHEKWREALPMLRRSPVRP